MSLFTRERPGLYSAVGHRLKALVELEGEIWVCVVYVDGHCRYSAEWGSLKDAIGNAMGAMSRAGWLRRFEPDPPMVPEDDELEDEDEDDE